MFLHGIKSNTALKNTLLLDEHPGKKSTLIKMVWGVPTKISEFF